MPEKTIALRKSPKRPKNQPQNCDTNDHSKRTMGNSCGKNGDGGSNQSSKMDQQVSIDEWLPKFIGRFSLLHLGPSFHQKADIF